MLLRYAADYLHLNAHALGWTEVELVVMKGAVVNPAAIIFVCILSGCLVLMCGSCKSAF